MSLLDKAANLSGEAIDKVDHLVVDGLIAKTIIRVGEQKDRIKKLLEKEDSLYRICGIEVDDTMPRRLFSSLASRP